MDDSEKLMLAIYEETVGKDMLFAGDDALMKRLGIDLQVFSRLHAILTRKGYLATSPVQMQGLSNSGVEYVENRLR